jgi:hypothetical protein
MTLDWTSTLLADLVWGLALATMTYRSVRAWRRMDPDAWAPLQWNRAGRPIMRAQRDLAVAFTPLVALAGGLLFAAGARLGDDYQTGWAAMRLTAPVLLAAAHHAHMRGAVKTLKAEGALKPRRR